MPAFPAPGRGNLGSAEALGHLIQAGGLARGGIPGNHLRYHGSLDWGKASPARSPRAFGIEQIAGGGAGPRPQWAPAQLGWAPAAHPLGAERALIRRHSAANL